MSHKERIHSLVHECASELLAAIREREPLHADRWVPAVELKDSLQLNFVPYPKSSEQHGAKGWLFAILAEAPRTKRNNRIQARGEPLVLQEHQVLAAHACSRSKCHAHEPDA